MSGLDFDDHPEYKSNFARYAVELRRMNPIVYTKKNPLPLMKDLAKTVGILLSMGLHQNKEPRRKLEKILQTTGIAKTWFPTQYGPCDCYLRISSHLGA